MVAGARLFVRSGSIELHFRDESPLLLGDGSGEAVKVYLHRLPTLIRIMTNPGLALGETYVDGEWEVDDADLARFLGVTESRISQLRSEALAMLRAPVDGVIQGLAWGLDIPVVPVSSLQAVALAVAEQKAAEEGDGIAVAFDARMDEVYWGCYQMRAGLPQPLAPERVCAPEQVSLPEPLAQWLAGGSGWRYADRMPESVTRECHSPVTDLSPDARHVARLALVSARVRRRAGVRAR